LQEAGLLLLNCPAESCLAGLSLLAKRGGQKKTHRALRIASVWLTAAQEICTRQASGTGLGIWAAYGAEHPQVYGAT